MATLDSLVNEVARLGAKHGESVWPGYLSADGVVGARSLEALNLRLDP